VRSASISARVVARDVRLVLTSEGGRPRRVRVRLDGRAIAPGDAVRGAAVTVRGQRLYHLVGLDAPGEHVLTLRLEPGVSGFAFAFG
jgi:hypothetical protein